MLKFNVKYLKQLLECFWSIYKPGKSHKQRQLIQQHISDEKLGQLYTQEFRIPLQLSASCLTNVTVWHEIAPKSSFMVLFGTTYEETRGGHKRMKHSASEKNSGHVCALSGKPLWSCSLSKGHWRMNKLLKHIIPLFRSTPCKPGPWCLFFFRGFTHLERLTFATNYFMAFKTDYQKKVPSFNRVCQTDMMIRYFSSVTWVSFVTQLVVKA